MFVMGKIEFLDCTLRDGAHVNSGEFGEQHIKHIVSSLTEAAVDYVEVGFLKNVMYSKDVTSYPQIEDAYSIMTGTSENSAVHYSLMARADTYDLSKLSDCDGRIGLIRVAFYYDYLEKALEFAKQVRSKGYNFTLNLINTPGSPMDDLRYFVECANDLYPYAVTIVDTFGVLDVPGMKEIATMYDSILDKKIRMGLHVHENLSSAFSLAKGFLECVSKDRNVIIDGSLMGMGRAPGNLCTELICDYLNVHEGKTYGLSHILKSISVDIAPIKSRFKWGYSPEYFLSAKYRVHRSYAEYLSDLDVPFDVIDRILSKIDAEHSLKFDLDYLQGIVHEVR